MKLKHLGVKKASIRSEREAAKFFKGRVQPASGAINRFDLKADVKSDKFLVDDKHTRKQSYSIKVSVWRTLSKQAWMNNLRPVLRINFEDGPAIYVIDEQTMRQLI